MKQTIFATQATFWLAVSAMVFALLGVVNTASGETPRPITERTANE